MAKIAALREECFDQNQLPTRDIEYLREVEAASREAAERSRSETVRPL